MPLGPLFGSSSSDDITGSITPRDGRFSNNMSDADWADAKTALQAALEPKNAGAPALWQNPASGLKGAITPVASAYSSDTGLCQAFVATLVEGTDTHWYQGSACRDSTETWRPMTASLWTPPPAK